MKKKQGGLKLGGDTAHPPLLPPLRLLLSSAGVSLRLAH